MYFSEWRRESISCGTAIESIQRLAPGREALTTPLLKEVYFQTVDLLPIRMSVSSWDILDYFITGARIRLRRPCPELSRAQEATEWLLSRVAPSSSLLAVTHRGFRRYLWACLVDRGWTPEFRRKRYHNWSIWSFRRP